MECAQVSHGKLRVEAPNELLKKCRRGRSKDDVVDVEEQVGDTGPVFVDKEGGVGGRGDEAELANACRKTLVPGSGSLLQAVEGALQQTHMVRKDMIDEAWGLLAVDGLLQMSMEKNILDV